MSDFFNVGDVVRLKNGTGPNMTVDNVESYRVYTLWFVGDVLNKGQFNSALLENVNGK